MSEDVTVCMLLQQQLENLCDGYCKYREEYLSCYKDPDEAFEEARVQFSRLYPRCGAAVFYKSDAERPDKLAVLYDVHDSILNNAGVKDANELVFDR